MKRLFGTDGIRGVANRYPMTVEMAVNIGRATVAFFMSNDTEKRIVVGKDTRLSGDMLESALVAGICSAGADAHCVGILPTPGIAYLAGAAGASGGIVISASHNPFYDNGIKIFKKDGFKLSDKEEVHFEKILFDERPGHKCNHLRDTGRVQAIDRAYSQYQSFLLKRFPKDFSLKGFKVVLDCSHGATYRVAPELFKRLGADIIPMNVSPNGRNINDSCGSQYLTAIRREVTEKKADLGLAFDGDGDRVVAVDENGQAVTGDQILAICASYMKTRGKLKGNRVVSTVMSNFGLGAALEALGIEHVIADVGDRYVLEKMFETDAVLGGEDSGHIIFLEDHTTGDGILAGLKLMEVMREGAKSLSQLSAIMTVYPQVLINVEVGCKPDLQANPSILEAITSAENKLQGRGRVLVRYSGTQPLCRIMVESPDAAETKKYAQAIAAVVKKTIGKNSHENFSND
ncbi:MAG: phosphoglucosamine mutase [Deltaproteobacteria bacterium]|nr:phosphoglucosamine mutase [Deltaproteobacteria bacterium]